KHSLDKSKTAISDKADSESKESKSLSLKTEDDEWQKLFGLPFDLEEIKNSARKDLKRLSNASLSDIPKIIQKPARRKSSVTFCKENMVKEFSPSSTIRTPIVPSSVIPKSITSKLSNLKVDEDKSVTLLSKPR